MEFVRDSEVMDLLREQGVVPASEGEDDERIYLTMDGVDSVVKVHLATAEASAEPAEGARVVTMDASGLPDAIDGLIHKLHLTQFLLVPVGRWRHLFDAVAFSLAEHEGWQAVDTAATVELNTRDPLLCEAGDIHTVSAMLRALLEDGSEAEQGVMLTTTSSPLLVEVIPDGAVRMSFGNQAMADEVAEAIDA